MPKPICVPCQRFFKPKKNGFPVIEGMPIDNHAKPGTSMPESWEPYKLWISDLWECQGCGAQIALVNTQPVSEHYMPDFAHMMGVLQAKFQVNDC